MRKLLPLPLAAILVAVGIGALAAPAQAADGCYITASSATIRSAPATRSTALGITYRGDRCAEKDWRDGWTKVVMRTGGAKGRTGWVRDDLVHNEAEDVRTCIPEDVACHN